jgi:hypothetical protein
MGKFIRYTFQVILGALFGAVCFMALSPALAAIFPVAEDGVGTSLAVLGIVLLIVAVAPSIRRALGRGFLLAGASVFALPLSTMMLSGRAFDTMNKDAEAAGQAMGGAEAAGAALGGVMMTGFAGFVGFFFGSILLIIGLVLALGGRRDVRVVA